MNTLRADHSCEGDPTGSSPRFRASRTRLRAVLYPNPDPQGWRRPGGAERYVTRFLVPVGTAWPTLARRHWQCRLFRQPVRQTTKRLGPRPASLVHGLRI